MKKSTFLTLSAIIGLIAIAGAHLAVSIVNQPDSASSTLKTPSLDQEPQKSTNDSSDQSDANPTEETTESSTPQQPTNPISDSQISRKTNVAAQRAAEEESRRISDLRWQYIIQRTSELQNNRVYYNAILESCKDPGYAGGPSFISNSGNYTDCVYRSYGGNYEDYTWPLTDAALQRKNRETNEKYDTLCAEIGGC